MFLPLIRRTAALAVVLSTTSLAQSPLRPQGHDGGAAARAALAPLANLVGLWEGQATVFEGPGQSKQVRQFEDVVWGAEKTVLLVRGTGKMMTSDSVVFAAAAVIWYDATKGKLAMRTHRSEGLSVEPEIELRPDTLIWGFQSGPGRVRFTIAYTKDSWHEVGEFLMPGRPPYKTIDLRLRRP